MRQRDNCRAVDLHIGEFRSSRNMPREPCHSADVAWWRNPVPPSDATRAHQLPAMSADQWRAIANLLYVNACGNIAAAVAFASAGLRAIGRHYHSQMRARVVTSLQWIGTNRECRRCPVLTHFEHRIAITRCNLGSSSMSPISAASFGCNLTNGSENVQKG